ncbi:MAG: lysine--tRNA ligase [Gemmataceae bacterium]|nr:lysine--tRNA ligase [Gemmataceae bacterium]
MTDTPDILEDSRLDKLKALTALGVDPWGMRFDNHLPIAQARDLPIQVENPAPVRIAGRIVLRRGMGNVHFLNLRDWTGQIQVMAGKKQVGEQGWGIAKNLDLGDLLGVDGHFGKTKTGELTVFANKLTFLGKSLLPHPDKWEGMQDMEFRLRHRYLDLTYTPDTLRRARERIHIVRSMRRFLDDQGFWEVETPTLHSIAGGAAARPFITHHNALDIDLYLRIALELHLKRLLVGGIEKVYEIGRVFRNEGISPRHNPEFTMMELYQAYSDYQGMMDLTEGLILNAIEALGGDKIRPYGGHTIDFTPPWRRASYADLFREHTGADLGDPAAVAAAADSANIITKGKHPDVLIQELFELKVERQLMGPIFVYDYPASLCPLTKRKQGNPALAERFELFINGMELANAYTELNDPVTQEETFRAQLSGLKEEDSMAKMDDDFVRALKHGMPPAGGLGIGIDRLVMLLTNTPTIRDVILFPLLRPEGRPEPVG